MFNTFLLALAEVLATTLLMLAAGVGAPLFIRWCCLVGSVLLEKWQAWQEFQRIERQSVEQAKHDRAITDYFEGVGR